MMSKDRPVIEVALECGYDNPAAFSRAFRQQFDAMTVAYVRHIGPYAGDGALFASLFGKLFAWAGPRGLVKPAD